MSFFSCLLSIAAAAPLLVASAQAQGAPDRPRERPRPVLLALDLDHDGTLSADEIKAASSSLSALDRNSDGQLTPDELEPPRSGGLSPDQLVQQFMAFDHAGKGYLIPTDLPERMRPTFARADADHDGKLTPAEIRLMATRNGAPGGRTPSPGSARGNMRLDPVLNALDRNHDGILSAEEIAQAPESLRTLDANHDGRLTPDEMMVRQQTPAERADHLLEEYDTNQSGKLTAEELPDGLRPRFAEADRNHDGFLDREELIQLFTQPQPAKPPQ